MQTFIAKYKGTCEGCISPIQPGDEVTFNSWNDVVHVSCPDNLTEGTSHGFCPTCFTALPASGHCSNCD